MSNFVNGHNGNNGHNGYTPNFVFTSQLIEEAQQDRAVTSSTEYLTHPDYPALFIKATLPGLSRRDAGIEAIRKEFSSYYDLEVPGLRVVPFSVMQFAGELVVMAHRVQGVPLEEELVRNPEAVEEYDQVFTRQIMKLARQRGQDRLYPSDAYGPQQFMWGTLWGDGDKQGIIFVDVEANGGLIGNLKDLATDSYYLNDLTDIAYSLISTKTDLGIELPSARGTVMSELEQLRQRGQCNGSSSGIDAARYALAHYDLSVID